jgi:L-Ala-D/L-Glu epimerase
MKIERVETLPLSIPLKKKYEWHKGAFTDVKFVVLRIYTDDGIIGFGEACPNPTQDGQTVGSIKYAIDHYIAPTLVGKDPFERNLLIDIAEKCVPGNSCSLCAVDIALHDIVGKACKLPVSSLLGGTFRKRVLVDAELSMGTLEETRNEAISYVSEGAHVLRVKVGENDEEDLRRIKAIREEFGDEVKISCDANEAWTVKRALNFIKRAEKFGLYIVEQPIPHWDLDGMAAVTKATECYIVADEGFNSPQDVLRLVDHKAADVLGLKLTKGGGFTGNLKNVAVAAAGGIPCLIGSMEAHSVGVSAKTTFSLQHSRSQSPMLFQ